MKRYSILERDADTAREIKICDDNTPSTTGGINLWRTAIGICLWLGVLIELVVRAVVGVF